MPDARELAVALLAVEGAAGIVFEVLVVTYLQRSAPGPVLSTVASLQSSASGAAQLLGSLLAPVLVSLTALPVALLVAGGAVVAASAALAPGLQRMAQQTEARRRSLAPVVEVLAPLALFSKASAVALERLAVGCRWLGVRDGEVVVREGDVASEFFVVVDGEFSVVSRGEGAGGPVEVNRLYLGDWFGEIGLLHRPRRTATVRAERESVLLAVPGDAFVVATSGSDALADPLRRTMAVRLARTHPGLLDGDDNDGDDLDQTSPR